MQRTIDRTDRQQLLELQQKKPIGEIIREAMENHRGERNWNIACAMDLGISLTTLYDWAKAEGIELAKYKRRGQPAAPEEINSPEGTPE